MSCYGKPMEHVRTVMKQFSLSLLLAIGGLGAFYGTAIADTVLQVETGTASIENPDFRRIRSASPGTSLRVGDLIRPYFDAVVVIRCESGTVRRVRSIVGLGDICPDSVGRRFSARGRGEDDFLMFLNHVFTYATQVNSAHPELRWDAVERATSYHVQMLQNDEVIWQDRVEDTSVTYGGEGLEPGENYVLTVMGLLGGDVDMPGEERVMSRESRVVLRRLSEAEAFAVEDAVALVESEELTDEGRAIALAQIYQGVAETNALPPEGVGLVFDLISVLEPLIEEGNRNSYLNQLLGDLYLQVGLVDEAQRQYQNVIWITTTRQDVPSRAAAWVGLANIAARSGNLVSARDNLQFAQANYQAIADEDRVVQINEWLGKL